MRRKVAWDIEERKLVQVVPVSKKEKQSRFAFLRKWLKRIARSDDD